MPRCRRPSARCAASDLRRAVRGTPRARARSRATRSPTLIHTSGCCAISRAVQAAPRDSSSAAAQAREAVRAHAAALDGAAQAAMYGRSAGAMPSCSSSAVVPAMRPVAHGIVLARQELAEKRERYRPPVEPLAHRRAGALHVRVRPVVADAIAQAELQVEIEALALAMVVAAPVLRVGAHRLDDDLAQVRHAPVAVESPARWRRAPRASRAARRSRPDRLSGSRNDRARAPAGRPPTGSRSNAPRRRTATAGR